MSRVQLTKKEAREEIDKILEKQFDLCVTATYNELIAIINENALAGRKKVKGTLIIGFNPRNQNYEDICFDIEKADIVNLWHATLGGKRASLKQLEKFTSKYDLFCWDYNDYHTFGLKLFTGGLLGGMTKTGKMFVQQLRKMLSDCGMRLSFKWDGLVTDCKINYTCNIPNGYVPKKIIGASKGMSVAQAQDALRAYFSKFDGDENYSETEYGGICSINVEIKELQRVVSLGVLIDATRSLIAVNITLGRVFAEQVDFATMLIDKYNATKLDDDFSATLTDPTEDGFDGQLLIMNMKSFNNQEDLFEKLDILLPKAIKLCESSELIPFIKVTKEL